MSKTFYTRATTSFTRRTRYGTLRSTHARRMHVVRADMEQYHILQRIGEGAHGVVLRAKHLKVLAVYYCGFCWTEGRADSPKESSPIYRMLEDVIPNSALRYNHKHAYEGGFTIPHMHLPIMRYTVNIC